MGEFLGDVMRRLRLLIYPPFLLEVGDQIDRASSPPPVRGTFLFSQIGPVVSSVV